MVEKDRLCRFESSRQTLRASGIPWRHRRPPSNATHSCCVKSKTSSWHAAYQVSESFSRHALRQTGKSDVTENQESPKHEARRGVAKTDTAAPRFANFGQPSQPLSWPRRSGLRASANRPRSRSFRHRQRPRHRHCLRPRYRDRRRRSPLRSNGLFPWFPPDSTPAETCSERWFPRLPITLPTRSPTRQRRTPTGNPIRRHRLRRHWRRTRLRRPPRLPFPRSNIPPVRSTARFKRVLDSSINRRPTKPSSDRSETAPTCGASVCPRKAPSWRSWTSSCRWTSASWAVPLLPTSGGWKPPIYRSSATPH